VHTKARGEAKERNSFVSLSHRTLILGLGEKHTSKALSKDLLTLPAFFSALPGRDLIEKFPFSAAANFRESRFEAFKDLSECDIHPFSVDRGVLIVHC
jgi:hypothetical protein